MRNSQIKKIVEIGFGDYNIAKHYNIPEGKKYIGFDVVQSLLQKNTSFRQFRIIQSIHDMNESGDLLITKEVMQHWPNEAVAYYLENIVPRFKYVILQNGATDGPQRDIKYGQWRPLNLNLYEPKELLFEFPLDHRHAYIIPKWPEEQ